MFEKHYEKRLESWSKFRESLEESEDPLREIIQYYKQAPYLSIHTDPWNEESWPSPWELIHENQYDDFSCVLGMCYSLQLTDRFKASSFEIHISTFDSLGYLYLLYVDDYVLGYDDKRAILKSELPKDIRSQHRYVMSRLQ
jgi:hypothetical protein